MTNHSGKFLSSAEYKSNTFSILHNREITNARYKLFYLVLGTVLAITLLILLNASQQTSTITGVLYGLLAPKLLIECFGDTPYGAALRRKIK